MEVEIQTQRFSFIPIRIRRTVEDDFFEEYREENLQSKQTISHSDHLEVEMYKFESYRCQVPGCSAVLTSQDSYNNHYNLTHKHVCNECHRIYPSAHLLDIHISEWHDAYFQLKSQKENSFHCLIETCVEVFATSKQRHKHLIQGHNFPSDFRFEIPNPKKSDKKTNKMVVETTECEMEVDVADAAPKKTSKVPSTICFGKGANRGFHRQRKKNH
uniref:C2H2-type domain-containing protein n=1 Tax=Strigamia maritima TaxID=126957 RepID=T1IL16_STRMM